MRESYILYKCSRLKEVKNIGQLKSTPKSRLYWGGKFYVGHYQVNWQNWNMESRFNKRIMSMLNLLTLLTVLWFYRRISLFLETAHPSIWGKDPWCMQLTPKWFRKKYCMYTHTHTHLYRVQMIKQMVQNGTKQVKWIKCTLSILCTNLRTYL